MVIPIHYPVCVHRGEDKRVYPQLVPQPDPHIDRMPRRKTTRSDGPELRRRNRKRTRPGAGVGFEMERWEREYSQTAGRYTSHWSRRCLFPAHRPDSTKTPGLEAGYRHTAPTCTPHSVRVPESSTSSILCGVCTRVSSFPSRMGIAETGFVGKRFRAGYDDRDEGGVCSIG